MRAAHPGIVGILPVALVAMLLVACSRLPTADSSVDPAQRGPYAVGLTRLSRVLPNGQTRAVETYVWYPAPDQGGQWAATASVKYGVGRAVALAGRSL